MFKLLRLFLCVSVLVIITACSAGPNSGNQNAYYVDNIIEVDIPSYDDHAIVAVRLGTNPYLTDVSAGELPDPSLMRSNSSSSYLKLKSEKSRAQFSERALPSDDLMMSSFSQSSLKSALTLPKKSSLVTDSTNSTTFSVYQGDDSITGAPIFYEESAVRLYNGDHCYIFVSQNAQSIVDTDLITEIGEYFDDVIYPRSTAYFSMTPYDVDANSKTILYYTDIGSAAGFFLGYDLSSGTGSNQADMLYISLDYILNSQSNTVSDNARVVAHEFQHLLNKTARILGGTSNQYETWIEEGIAEGATKFVLSDDSLYEHFETIAEDPAVTSGMGLISWTGYIQDYALTFTFLEYARIQSDMGVDFYEDLMNNFTEGFDYRAVFDVIDDNSSKFTSFEDVMRDYRFANLINADDGLYSYGNSSGNEYQSLIPSINSPTNSTAYLGVGGALYFMFDSEYNQDFLDFLPYNIGSTDIYYYRINGED